MQVLRGEPDDFTSSDDFSELQRDIHSHTIEDSAAYYVVGYLLKMFVLSLCKIGVHIQLPLTLPSITFESTSERCWSGCEKLG